jgi:hypothetical protein
MILAMWRSLARKSAADVVSVWRPTPAPLAVRVPRHHPFSRHDRSEASETHPAGAGSAFSDGVGHGGFHAPRFLK